MYAYLKSSVMLVVVVPKQLCIFATFDNDGTVRIAEKRKACCKVFLSGLNCQPLQASVQAPTVIGMASVAAFPR